MAVGEWLKQLTRLTSGKNLQYTMSGSESTAKLVFFCVVDVILGMPVSLRVFKLRAQTKRISLFAATTDKVALTIQAQQ